MTSNKKKKNLCKNASRKGLTRPGGGNMGATQNKKKKQIPGVTSSKKQVIKQKTAKKGGQPRTTRTGISLIGERKGQGGVQK